MLDLLGSLVDQSLVIAEEHEAGVRYRLLETVRQYGLERLAEAGEEEAVRARHRDHFLALAEEAGPHLETGRQREWLELLDPEAANLAAAIEYALGSEPALAATLLRGALSLVVCARSLRRGRAGAFALRWRPAATASPRCAHARFTVAPTSPSGWASSKLRKRTRPRRWRSRRRSATREPRRGRAASSVTRWLFRTRAPGERSSRARPSSPGRRAMTGRSCRPSRQRPSPTCTKVSTREAARANEEVAALAERLGDPLQVARRWLWVAVMAQFDGRFAEAREALERVRAAVAATGEPVFEAGADALMGLVDVWQGEPERPLERLPGRLERTLKLGAGIAVP